MNTKYQTINIAPYRRSSFQPFKWVARTKNTTVDSRDTVEYVRPGSATIKQREFEFRLATSRLRTFMHLWKIEMHESSQTRAFAI